MRKLARGLVTLVVATSLCAGGLTPASAETAIATLAYSDSQGLHLWRAGHVTTLTTASTGNVHWSADGTLITWVTYNRTSTVHVASAAGTHQHHWACSCNGGARFIGHTLRGH